MVTLGDIAGDALKQAGDALKDASATVETEAPHPEAMPTLENGEAVPPKPKRRYTKRDTARWGPAATGVGTEGGATAVAARAATPKKHGHGGKTVKIQLAKGAGETMVQGAAIFPIIAADVVGTIASKGKFQLFNYVTEEQKAECVRTFQEGVLGTLEIECDPIWAWPITCGLVVGSALMNAGLMYAIAMKQKAGTIPPGRMPNGATAGPGPGMDEVHGQSPSSPSPSA